MHGLFVCMVFSPKDKSKIVAQSFPAFCLGGNLLKFVFSFKYLRHILTDNSRNDSDIEYCVEWRGPTLGTGN